MQANESTSSGGGSKRPPRRRRPSLGNPDADPVQVHRRYVEQRLWSGNTERTETEAEAEELSADNSGTDDSSAEDSGAEDSGAEDSGAEDSGSGEDAQVPATQEELTTELARQGYEQATEQWHQLPGALSRPPTEVPAVVDAEESEEPDGPDEPEDGSESDDAHRHRLGTGGPEPDGAGRPPGQRADAPRSRSAPTTPTSSTRAPRAAGCGAPSTAATTGPRSSTVSSPWASASPAAIAIDPTDSSTLYVGTSSRVTPQAQAGLYKSTDGGASCIRLGSGYPAGNTGNATQFFNQDVNVIIVDPANPQTVYLASAAASSARPTAARTGPRAPAPAATPGRSCSTPPHRPRARILYAGITGVGVVRSTDGGPELDAILNGTTPAVVTAIGATPGAGFSKAIVDLAPPTSPPNAAGVQVLYVALSGHRRCARPRRAVPEHRPGRDLDPAHRHRACRAAPRAATASTWRSTPAPRATAPTTRSMSAASDRAARPTRATRSPV